MMAISEEFVAAIESEVLEGPVIVLLIEPGRDDDVFRYIGPFDSFSEALPWAEACMERLIEDESRQPDGVGMGPASYRIESLSEPGDPRA